MMSLSTTFSRFCARAAILVAAVTILAGASLQVYAEKSNPRVLESYRTLDENRVMLVRGKADIIQLPGMAADVLVANPAIVDVQALQADRLYMVGMNVGDTNIIVLDESGNMLRKYDVHVRIDTDAIQSMVTRLFPGEDVTVETIHDQLLVRGTVSNPAASNRITRLVSAYFGDVMNQTGTPDDLIENLLDVRGDQQVMLRVKIMEASRNLFKELGVSTDVLSIGDADDVVTGVIGSLIDLPRPPIAGGMAGINPRGNVGPINIYLDTLEEQGLVNILAEPNLTSISGETASFLAGGEIPVPVSRDDQGNVQVDYRAFGVRLSFRPVVMSEDRITLQLNSEVSSLNPANGVGAIPGMDTRNIQTTVELPSGGSLMIGGLLQSNAVKGMSGLPGIMNVPVLGNLVKSDSFERRETELVVVVTPYLVRPYADRKKVSDVTGDADIRANARTPNASSGAPLATALSDNLRRVYKNKMELPQEIMESGEAFGYVID